MSSLGIGGGVVIAIAVAVGFVVLFGVVLMAASRAARKSAEAARAKYPNARHVEGGALFFGQESRGAMQARGNGTLVLTESELVFNQWVVDREFRVPYSAIQSIETPRSFLGKSQGVRLLKVSYLNDAGTPDAMAWRVRELEASIGALEEARAALAPGA
jgi:hypothetical protein